jgi:hypothetical protein
MSLFGIRTRAWCPVILVCHLEGIFPQWKLAGSFWAGRLEVSRAKLEADGLTKVPRNGIVKESFPALCPRRLVAAAKGLRDDRTGVARCRVPGGVATAPVSPPMGNTQSGLTRSCQERVVFWDVADNE